MIIANYGNNQFGFRPKYSTIHAYIKVHDHITRFLESRQVKAVLIISFDMRKAFDSLNHENFNVIIKNVLLFSPWRNANHNVTIA